jgi:hypothetical protein
MKPIRLRAQRRPLVVVQRVDRMTVNGHGSRGRPVEGAKQVEHRRFARAGRPDDPDQLPVIDPQADVGQRPDRPERPGDSVQHDYGSRPARRLEALPGHRAQPSTISRIETGRGTLGFDVLVPLANALQVSLDVLFELPDNEDVVIRPVPHSSGTRTTSNSRP